MKAKIYLLLIMLGILLQLPAYIVNNQPVELTQPDGTVFGCYLSGDEYYRYLHDKDNYTIVKSPEDGYYYYGEQRVGDVVPSAYRADLPNPGSLGLTTGSVISQAEYADLRRLRPRPNLRIATPNQGNVNEVVFFIKFADQTEFVTTRQTMSDVFNSTTLKSQKRYFLEASYNALNFTSHIFPVCEPTTNLSYTDTHPRGYYMVYNASTNPVGFSNVNVGWQRMSELLTNVIDSLGTQVPADLNIDANNDGNIDNISFVFRGNSGQWADILWPQHGWFAPGTTGFNNKNALDFTLMTEDFFTGNVFCHEMFHSIGSPDLYHYSQDGFVSAGPWDIMQGGNFSHMTAYMKYRYGGWIADIPVADLSEIYTLNPLTQAENNCYRFNLPNTTTEYIIAEYRKIQPNTFDDDLPGSGIIFYRINTAEDGEGNAQGPPDELYVYRPNGTSTNNGNYNQANFSADVNRTEFNDFTNPFDFLQDESFGEISINQIGVAGDTITFHAWPLPGFAQIQLHSTKPGVNYTQAIVTVNNSVSECDATGQTFCEFLENTYPISVQLAGHANYYGQVEIPGNEINNFHVYLSYLPYPESLSVSVNNPTVQLNWSFDLGNQEGFTYFRIYRKTNTGSWGQIGVTQTPAFTTGLVNPTLHHYYCIVANYTNGLSDTSNVVHVEPIGNNDLDQPVLKTGIVSIYPNPFNPSTQVSFSVKEDGLVTAGIYNTKGQKVKTLVNENKLKGTHTVVWNGKDDSNKKVGSGIYFFQMRTNGNTYQQKMLLLK